MDIKTTFNEHFGKTFQDLGSFSLAEVPSKAIFILKITDKFNKIVIQYRNHPSLCAIKKTCTA